jgi:multimeric flavodoxin WrbA
MSKIKVLGISGSPRKNKSSQFMLEEALDAAKAAAPELVETELYSISTKTFHGCDACFQCEKLGHCRKIDDDFGELRDKWLAADTVIYSVPVYHMGIPAQLKGFIDRLGHSVQETFNDRSMKVMGFLSTGDGFASGQESVMYYLNNHAIMLGSIPIGGLWPVGYIGIGGRVPYDTTLRKDYDKGDEHAVEAIEATRELSRQVILVTMLVKAGGEHYRDMLKEKGGFHFFLQRLDYE